MMIAKKVSRARPEAVLQEGEVKVFVKLPGGEEQEKATALVVSRFITDPAFVRVNAGVTRNTGNYESLRLDVSVTYPCYKEQLDEVFPRVAKMVNDYLNEELTNYGVGEQ